MKPLFVELFAGLHGWGEGALTEGFDVVGFDIVDMCKEIGHARPDGINLVLQDVRTIHGSQLKHASVIVASPPCTEYSYMAMPWKRAKQIAAALRGKAQFPQGYKGSRTTEELNALLDACFRIQQKACEAAGHHIPLIVENVGGAQSWVGRAAWHFGSYYLWGDLPALMPIPRSSAQKVNPDGSGHPPGSWFAIADSKNRGAKSEGQNWSRYNETGEVSPHCRIEAMKTVGHLNIRDGDGHSHTRHLTNQDEHVKGFNGVASGAGNLGKNELGRLAWSNSPKRRAAAAIAKIPFPLAQHIARCFK